MTEHDWVFKCGFCVNKCGFCLKESSIMLWFNRIYYALHDLQKRCERGETLAEAREKGTEVGSPDAEVEVAADQESMAEEKLQMRRRRGRSAGGGGGASPARTRWGTGRRRRGALPGVCRSGAIPRRKLARTGRSPLPSRLPKAPVCWPVESFRVGCRRGDMAGIPTGNTASKLGHNGVIIP